MIARVNINVADIRHEPSNKSERVSQGLFNELVEVIGEAPAMARVRFSNAYEGWIGKQFISEHNAFFGQGPWIVRSSLAPACEKPDVSARKLTYLPYGCSLYGIMDSGFLKIESARYGEIFIHEGNLLHQSKAAPPNDVQSDEIVREAEKFLGVPYLWGGRTFFGLDCSGFVGLIAEHFGRCLPRDSKDQRKEGREISRGEIRRGDLLFFPGHVALATAHDLFIHSSRKNGGVAYNSLNPSSPIYSESLDKSFAKARRIFT
jgi:hypothetical protein